MAGFIDLCGKRFGRLTVCAREHVTPKRTHWKCTCDCGGIAVVDGTRLKSGSTKSCGCLVKEISREQGLRNRQHGMSKTPEYKIWCGMKDRCYNEDNPDFTNYGGRGIVVWYSWLKSFPNFYADLGPRPSPTHTLDRIDNSGPYQPDNCRWATPVEQANNKRNNNLHLYNGELVSLSQIAQLTGIPQPTLWSRLNRMELTIDEAIAWVPYNQIRNL